MARNLESSEDIIVVPIEEEVKNSYLDYAMSVIISRALPDVRDGLKPVHRRILYSMIETGFSHDKPHKKCAHVVGDVIAKYHPHGTDPVYGAMARLAQPFSMRTCLVDGRGNFGSVDGDRPAAMRYTEARLSSVASFILEDYDKKTVDFQPNYDGTHQMPMVLPARFPNLLVNGASGIAVGMATNIPCHNLGEVIDACCLLIDCPKIGWEELATVVKGPDFPTGGVILGSKGIKDAYRTGKGSFIVRGTTTIEPFAKDREAIIINSLPYQTNKSDMVEHIARLVNNKEIEGISEIRDESDRHGIRVVIELKRDAVAQIVLNHLYSMTALQSSFAANMLALNRGRPVQMSLKEILQAFIDFRKEVIVRRTQFYLYKSRQRAHILMGLLMAVTRIDEVIALIKSSANSAQALEKLIKHSWGQQSILKAYLDILEEKQKQNLDDYFLSEAQAQAILDLKLHRLTNMEQGKLVADLESLKAEILNHLKLLASDQEIFNLMKKELLEVKNAVKMPRLTQLEEEAGPHCDEDFIVCEEMVVTVSVSGYIKRTPLDTYRSQKRGGRGRHAMSVKQEDPISQVFVADTHTILLFFTSRGRAYQMKVYELPLGTTGGRGKPLVTFFPLEEGETLATLIPLPKSLDQGPGHILFATSHGNVRKNALTDFLSIRSNGKNAIRLSDGEFLIGVQLSDEKQNVLLSTRLGKSIRFSVNDLRQFSGRDSTGVRGMNLKDGDCVVSMSLLRAVPWNQEEIDSYMRYKAQQRRTEEELSLTHVEPEPAHLAQMEEEEEFILCVTDKGFGKRTSAYNYRQIRRGGSGVDTMELTLRTGHIVNALPVKSNDQILLMTNQGQLLRCPVDDIRISGRKTQGVRVFRLEPEEHIVSLAVLPWQEGEEGDEETQE